MNASVESSSDQPQTPGAAAPPVVVGDGATGDETTTLDTWVELGGDASLSLVEANQLAHEYGATVILIAGEQESGKTTLLVALYGQFLLGPFDGTRFAGSQTLDAFDARHFGTRYDSGNKHASTPRTHDEDVRLLHLRVLDAEDQQRVLLPSDVKGELFERVIDGSRVDEDLSIAARADKTMLLIDGAQIADPSSRQVAIHRARQLIGGLTEPDGLQVERPMALVLTKCDVLNDAVEEWFAAQAENLVGWAESRQAHPVQVLMLAARPDESPDEPENLDEALRWMLTTTPDQVRPHRSTARSNDRVFWNASFGRPGPA